MSNIIVPRKSVWTQQPQCPSRIDPRWLSRGLVDAIDFSAPTPRSLILGTPAVSFGAKPVPSVDADKRVSSSIASFGGWVFQSPNGAYAASNSQTHIAVAEFSAFTGRYAGLFVVADGSGANNAIALQYGSATNLTQYVGNGVVNLDGATPLVSGSGIRVIALQAGPYFNALYVRGSRVASGNANGDTIPTFSTSRMVFFGDRAGSASYATKGKYALHLVFNTVLSEAEVKALSDNPYQIFRHHHTIIRIGTVSASNDHSLVASNIVAGAPVLGAPLLSQNHSITASPLATGAPTLGTPAVTQNHAIAASGVVTGSPVLGSPVLTDVPTGGLVANGITTGQPTLGSPALTQNHTLVAGAIAAGAPVFGPVTLVQQHAMLADGIVTGSPVLGSPALTSAAPGAEVWPSVSDVRLGVTYGPTGAEYIGTLTGGSGPSAESIAAAVVSALQGTTIPFRANVTQMNGHTIIGSGIPSDKFRGSGV